MPKRSQAANTLRVDRLLLKKGWTAVDLAESANLSKRTIDNVLNGKLVYIKTLALVAEAFEVPLETILDTYEEPKPEEMLAVVTITTKLEMKGFTKEKEEEFVKLLMSALQSANHIVIKDTREGSVIFDIEMDVKTILALARFYQKKWDKAAVLSPAEKQLFRIIKSIQFPDVDALGLLKGIKLR